MAEKVFKVDEPIEIVYQAPNAESGLDSIKADIYDESKAVFSVDNPLTEVGSTGTYRASFTPDAQGEWEVVIYKFIDSFTRDGQVVKRYSVGAHNVHSVGEGVSGITTAVADVDSDVVALDTKVDSRADTTDGKVDNLDGDVATLDGKVVDLDSDVATLDTKADTTHTKLDALDTKVSSLDTPPMVS